MPRDSGPCEVEEVLSEQWQAQLCPVMKSEMQPNSKQPVPWQSQTRQHLVVHIYLLLSLLFIF